MGSDSFGKHSARDSRERHCRREQYPERRPPATVSGLLERIAAAQNRGMTGPRQGPPRRHCL